MVSAIRKKEKKNKKEKEEKFKFQIKKGIGHISTKYNVLFCLDSYLN